MFYELLHNLQHREHYNTSRVYLKTGLIGLIMGIKCKQVVTFNSLYWNRVFIFLLLSPPFVQGNSLLSCHGISQTLESFHAINLNQESCSIISLFPGMLLFCRRTKGPPSSVSNLKYRRIQKC